MDFVVRDRKNPAIIYFAVELDGHESHRFREETIINDKFKTRIFGEKMNQKRMEQVSPDGKIMETNIQTERTCEI